MKKIIIIAIFSISALSAFSQNGYTALQYSMGFGTGNLKEFIGPASFRGFTFDYRNTSLYNIGIGVEFGWNVFYEEFEDTEHTVGNTTYSGKQWHYTNYWPMLFGADYIPNPDATFSPFAGLGLGTLYTLQNTDMSAYTFEVDAWHFALRPEIGFTYNPAPDFGLMLVGKYYYGFGTNDLDAQGYFTINVGLVFRQ
jgi:hypothetical protein